tara:strand:- start:1674 stop:1886 length:213 start_codon:yes stop_codon:yes gene_type:complete
MPFITETVEETISDLKTQTDDLVNTGDKSDVVFVILIVVVLWAFSRFTAIILKSVGAIIVALGLYTLFLT